VLIAGKGLRDSEATHYEKRNLIDDSRSCAIASLIRLPGLSPIFGRWVNEGMGSVQGLSQAIDRGAIGSPSSGIPAFEEDERRGYDEVAGLGNAIKSSNSRRVPLIALVPNGQEADRVEKYQSHG
jgi:hypothetical protein